jgi:hypothetical protein
MLTDAGHQENSPGTRLSAAFDAGYICLLVFADRASIQMPAEHPSREPLGVLKVILDATDYELALLLLEHHDPVTRPFDAKVKAEDAIAWAERMRALAVA